MALCDIKLHRIPPGCGPAWARRHGFDGVICGHIHGACLDGHGSVRVLSNGCWTHPPGTFLVETADGRWQLRDGHGHRLARLGKTN